MSAQRPQVLSTNTGGPKEYRLNGTTIRSSMRRLPQESGIDVTFLRVLGDEFDAAKIHGVREAVVYALASDFYADFAKAIDRPVEIGSFGENLTMSALNERKVMLGDEYEVGTVRLKVSAPRIPCNRLNFVFQNQSTQETFVAFGRPGVYFEVLAEGKISAGDVLHLSKSHHCEYSIADIFRLWRLQREVSLGKIDIGTVRHEFKKLVDDESVSEFVRSRFRKSL
ncbi:MAG: MOSC domain-containing protein [Deltaproteobacteria bacterium]|jgi:MOSC domain-containing protein YiiM|nr:MOSC domain-containing protein [Deltaproteobacteria bacterium]